MKEKPPSPVLLKNRGRSKEYRAEVRSCGRGFVELCIPPIVGNPHYRWRLSTNEGEKDMVDWFIHQPDLEELRRWYTRETGKRITPRHPREKSRSWGQRDPDAKLSTGPKVDPRQIKLPGT